MASLPSHILVIEDNDDHCQLFSTLLAGDGYIVDCARSAIAAHELLVTILPDLVICDLGIYGLADFGLLAILDADEKHLGVPVLFCTARDTRILGPRLKALDRPHTALLSKPFDIDVLLSLVGQLARPGAPREHSSLLGHRSLVITP